jgi:hypothetical protein
MRVINCDSSQQLATILSQYPRPLGALESVGCNFAALSGNPELCCVGMTRAGASKVTDPKLLRRA